MGKILGAVLFVLVVFGLWWASNRAKTNALREEVVQSFFGGQADAAFIDSLRSLYKKGGAEEKDLARRMLVSRIVPEDSVGCWDVSGVDETLKAGEGSPSSVKLAATNDLRLQVERTVWGEQTTIGVMETPAWAAYVLVNQSSAPVPVSRGFLVVHGGGHRFASTGFGEEHGDEPSIPAKSALKSASRFNTIGASPVYLEFNNGRKVVRALCPGAAQITNFRRDSSGWPQDSTLKEFPVRTPFSEQMLATAEANAYFRLDEPASETETAAVAVDATETETATKTEPVAATEPAPAAVATPKPAATRKPAAASQASLRRVWTNHEGKTVEAELVHVNGNVWTLRKDGKDFQATAGYFSQADQDYVDALPEKP